MSPRLLVILHPGNVTRHAMQSLVSAARDLGVLGATLEAQPIWNRVAAAGQNHVRERALITQEIAALCTRERITQALGYLGNLTYDCGLFPPKPGTEPDGPVGVFAALGVRHLMLWTDHPEWALKGAALDDPYRKLLAHPMHTHFVKSQCAAHECGPTTSGGVLGWRNVQAIHMGEDPALLTPMRHTPPTCGAVIIMSDPQPVPPPLLPLLDHDDPDPADLACLMLPTARAAWDNATSTSIPDALTRARLFEAWTAARIADPDTGFATLTTNLDASHAEALAALRSSPRAWYSAVTALRAITAWRRCFWPAWLAKRRRVELHGGDGSPMGIHSGSAGWIDYTDQPSIYARGAACLTINAAHDEEGLTHKAFQIAASGGAMLHHRTRGLHDCFDEGTETLAFSRGPELLDAVDRLTSDATLRARMGEAARARLERDHTWHNRLQQMLTLAVHDESAAQLRTAAHREPAPVAA